MQRVMCLPIAVLFLICLSNLNSLHAQQVLLQDSFESGDNVPENWFKGAAIPSVEYLWDETNASDGTRSLGFKKTDRDFSAVAQWVRKFDYDSGTQNIDFSAMIKARGATKAAVELEYLNLAREVIGKESIIKIGPKDASDRGVSHNWKRYSAIANVPEQTAQIVIALQLIGPGSVMFDAITISVAGGDAATAKAAPNTTSNRAPKGGIKPKLIQTPSGAFAQYILMPANTTSPRTGEGHPLILVLGGGDGSQENLPFAQSIQRQVLNGKYPVALLIAPPRNPWPTRQTQNQFACTEDAIEAVVESVSDEISIDRSKVIAIAWSSSGPATYSSMLSEQTSLTGALIAMSSFRKEYFPELSKISGRRFYLLHSPSDELTPYSDSQEARTALQEAGNVVQFKDYKGGHGWHGKSVEMIPDAVTWLLKD